MIQIRRERKFDAEGLSPRVRLLFPGERNQVTSASFRQALLVDSRGYDGGRFAEAPVPDLSRPWEIGQTDGEVQIPTRFSVPARRR